MNPSPDQLYDIFTYEPDLGVLKCRPGVRGCGVGFSKSDSRYVARIGKKYFFAHRVIWALVNGEWPADQIDHINGNSADNRLINLREATGRQNLANRKKHKNNTSGFKGVSRWRGRSTYRATVGGQHIGTFSTAKAAHEAYFKAAIARYGEFARAE